MKSAKVFSIVCAAIFCLFVLAGCAKSTKSAQQTEKISIVCTTFPQYDWVKNIIVGNEDKFSVALLMNKGSDLHNYQPAAQDMVRIASSDLFIHIGGNSDVWVKDSLKEATNKNMVVINLLETLGSGAKLAETVEGMQDEHHHDEDCDDEHDHEEHERVYEEHSDHARHNHTDEHVWLSLRNAEIFVSKIAEAVADLDSANKDTYKANAEKYTAQLKELDAEYTKAVAASTRKTIVFGDRFPFRYLVDDYGLEYFAAFSDCSAESEASFETIAFLADKVSSLNLPAVLTIEKSDRKIAQSIIANAGGSKAEVLELDSMQSVTSKDIEAGVNYLDVMKKNLVVLKKALN